MSATAWILDGRLVVDDSGQPIICDHCPCIEGIQCDQCDPHKTPAFLRLRISGVTQGSCDTPDGCADFWNNTEFELPQITNQTPIQPCYYRLWPGRVGRYDPDSIPCTLYSELVVNILPGSYIISIASLGEGVNFIKAKTSRDCAAEIKGSDYTVTGRIYNGLCNWDAATIEVL